MNLISIMLLIHFSFAQEPKVKKISELSQVEIFNSIDDFKQYHTNSFKVNLFRSPDASQRKTVRYPMVSYFIGVLNYNDSRPTLFEAGSFYNPEIMYGRRKKDAVEITIEHGDQTNRISTVLTITANRVEMD